MFTLKNIFLRFGGPPLLDHVSLVIERGERIAVLGRNGEGKSTLLRILTGQQVADDGEVIRSPGARIAEMPQEIPHDLPGSVRDVFLQVLFDHANTGGFSGSFTDGANLVFLRTSLKEAAVLVMGSAVRDVLITDIARQDS